MQLSLPTDEMLVQSQLTTLLTTKPLSAPVARAAALRAESAVQLP